MDIQLATLIITGITALIIFYYARETYKLRKATESQIELQLRPYLIFEREELGYYDANGDFNPAGYKAKLKNIGNGPALNIKVVDFRLTDYKKYNKHDIMLVNIKKNLLSRDSDEIIAFTIENGVRGSNISNNSFDDISFFVTSLVVEYKDIKNNKYVTKTSYGESPETWWDVNYGDIKIP